MENKNNCCKPNNGEKHNDGIVCEVKNCMYHDCETKNCMYHDCETYCTAEKIAVGPSYAATGSDTICATFKQKSE